MKKPLSKSLKRFFGIGDFGFGMMTNVESYFFSIFLTDIALFPVLISGAIMTITSVVDSILSPVYGGIINATKPMKWGRYRSWLLVGPPIVFVLYLFQYTKIGNEMTSAIIICAGFILSHIVWNIAWVANVSLIPLMCDSPEDRVLLSSHRALGSNLSRLVISYLGAPAVLLFAAVTGNDVLGYTVLAGLTAAAMWIGYWIHFKMTDGYEAVDSTHDSTKQNKEKASIRELLSNLFRNPPLLVLLVADLAKCLSNFVIAAMAAYYFKYVAQNEAMLPTFLLISSLAAVAGAYVSKFIGQKLSARTGSIILYFVAAAGLLLARLFAFNVTVYTVGVSIGLFAISAVFSLVVTLYADTVTYGEWKTGKNTAAFIMGMQNVPIKVGVIFRGIVVSAALGAAGFVAGETPTTQLMNDIATGMTVVPMVALVLGGFLLLFGYRITKEKLAVMEKEIELRNHVN